MNDNLETSDLPRVKDAIEAARQAAMKIGKVMYQGQSGSE